MGIVAGDAVAFSDGVALMFLSENGLFGLVAGFTQGRRTIFQ